MSPPTYHETRRFLGAKSAVVATWFLERSTRLPLDAVIGVLFVFALAVGLLILVHPTIRIAKELGL